MLSFYESDETLLTSILISTKNIQYYPLIVSLSEFNFNPTFLEYYNNSDCWTNSKGRILSYEELFNHKLTT